MKSISRLCLALSLSLAAGLANADPLLGDAALPAVPARLLAEQLRADRRAHPAAWQRVGELQGLRPEVYLSTRVRRPTVARELMGLGADALLPMLDVLVGGGYPQTLSDAERAALTLGALEAVGALRDRRAAPVLRAAFTRLTDPAPLRAAARGVAALGGAEDLAFLAAHLNDGDGRGLAALEGFGAQRSRASLDVVARVLDSSTDAAVVRAATRALGEIGSTWAQQAEGASDALPSAAAEPLVRAFLRTQGPARDAAQVAIVACGAPRAATLLTAALPAADAPTRARIAVMLRALRR